MKISLYMSSNRPYYWMPLYRQLETCKTEFEIVAVGDAQPNFRLPPNFNFIYSRTKPSQCYYIAAKYSKGEYLLNTPDDVVFSPNILDRVFEHITNGDAMYTLHYTPGQDKARFTDGREMYLPVGQICKRDIFFKYGIDKHFLGLYWDLDIACGFVADGGEMILLEDCCVTDQHPAYKSKSFLSRYHDGYDIKLFWKYWCNESLVLLPQRSRKVDPIMDRPDLLTVSQGERGKWR